MFANTGSVVACSSGRTSSTRLSHWIRPRSISRAATYAVIALVLEPMPNIVPALTAVAESMRARPAVAVSTRVGVTTPAASPTKPLATPLAAADCTCAACVAPGGGVSLSPPQALRAAASASGRARFLNEGNMG